MLSVDNPRVVRASPPQIGLPETGAVAEPNFMFRLPGREVYFLHGATRDAVRALREAGFTLYYFSDSAPGMMQHTYGYHPESLGMTKIEVSGRDAFFRANKPSALRDSLFDRSIGVSGRYACP
jgi:hypothetical protein